MSWKEEKSGRQLFDGGDYFKLFSLKGQVFNMDD